MLHCWLVEKSTFIYLLIRHGDWICAVCLNILSCPGEVFSHGNLWLKGFTGPTGGLLLCSFILLRDENHHGGEIWGQPPLFRLKKLLLLRTNPKKTRKDANPFIIGPRTVSIKSIRACGEVMEYMVGVCLMPRGWIVLYVSFSIWCIEACTNRARHCCINQ